jgi:hypothetical protein
VSYCGRYDGPSVTVTLWPTRREAEATKARIDNTACGGRCTRDHRIVTLRAEPSGGPVPVQEPLAEVFERLADRMQGEGAADV